VGWFTRVGVMEGVSPVGKRETVAVDVGNAVSVSVDKGARVLEKVGVTITVGTRGPAGVAVGETSTPKRT
jgi:hypothetical protein